MKEALGPSPFDRLRVGRGITPISIFPRREGRGKKGRRV